MDWCRRRYFEVSPLPPWPITFASACPGSAHCTAQAPPQVKLDAKISMPPLHCTGCAHAGSKFPPNFQPAQRPAGGYKSKMGVGPAALQVFYRSHIIGFLGFTVFSYMHYVGSWFMFMPPLMLYAIDLVFRAGQLAHTTPLHIRRLTQEDTIITVQMSTDKVSLGRITAQRCRPCRWLLTQDNTIVTVQMSPRQAGLVRAAPRQLHVWLAYHEATAILPADRLGLLWNDCMACQPVSTVGLACSATHLKEGEPKSWVPPLCHSAQLISRSHACKGHFLTACSSLGLGSALMHCP